MACATFPCLVPCSKSSPAVLRRASSTILSNRNKMTNETTETSNAINKSFELIIDCDKIYPCAKSFMTNRVVTATLPFFISSKSLYFVNSASIHIRIASKTPPAPVQTSIATTSTHVKVYPPESSCLMVIEKRGTASSGLPLIFFQERCQLVFYLLILAQLSNLIIQRAFLFVNFSAGFCFCFHLQCLFFHTLQTSHSGIAVETSHCLIDCFFVLLLH